MNLSEGVPDFICMKSASTNENTFLKVLKLPKGGIAVFDKGFNRYRYFDHWTQDERFFVTRLKDNAQYEVIAENKTAPNSDIIKDQKINVKYKDDGITRTVTLRLITYHDPVSGEILKFLTNLMECSAMTVTLLYKNRWVIELLFKQIKQNFELKYFLSDTENGIKSQIWVALILNLLFTLLHRRIKEAEDFSTMVMVAAKNLCSYVSLQMFLTNPTQYCKEWYKQEIENVQFEIPWDG
jgi:IS4 transposase